jgi:hypothetical protein
MNVLFKNAAVKDLYRKPGRKSRTDDLETKINRNLSICWEEINPLDAADLLKVNRNYFQFKNLT